MATNTTRDESETNLGQVPSWIAELSKPAADHSWRMVRDLQFGETELTARENALVGLSAASAIQCPYCTRFQGKMAELEGVTGSESAEVVNLAANIRLSTISHGGGIAHDDSVDETAEIAHHVRDRRETTNA